VPPVPQARTRASGKCATCRNTQVFVHHALDSNEFRKAFDAAYGAFVVLRGAHRWWVKALTVTTTAS
jgi:hypothetical protein